MTRSAHWGKWAAVLLIGAGLLVLSCRGLNSLLPSGDSPTADYDVDQSETLHLSGGQPQTLDPALTHRGPSGPIGSIFSGLVRLNTDLQVEPDLANGWQISDDGTLYTFYLHPEATFHDGRPITAEDVIYSWERATDPETASDTAKT